MEKPTSLQGYLEEYLKREGLYDVVPEYRRRSLFTLPIAFIWLAGLWMLATYFLLRYRSFSGLIVAILGPPVLFICALLVLAIFFAIRQFRLGRELTDIDAGMIGGVFLFGFPALIAVALGLYLRSWSVIVWYVVLCAGGMMFILSLQQQVYRVHLLIELIRSMFRVLWRSVTLLPVLAPLLLVIVLLSVFSQELWVALGGLSPSRLLGSACLIVLPAFLLVLVSLEQEARAIVGEFPGEEKIVENAEGILFIKNKLDSGLVSEEEWTRLKSELMWRDKTKLAEDLLAMLWSRVKRWLALLLGLTSISLVTTFFVYFYILFSVLLKPSVVAAWVDMQLETLMVPLGFFGHTWEVSLPSTVVPIAKVSLLLAIFVAVLSSVYALTDDSFKRRFTEWLSQKAAAWLSASCVYRCVVSPNYQIWEYVVDDREKGIANVSIVVPPGVFEEEIEEACEHVESRLQEYSHLVLVTAFEQNEQKAYRRGMPGKRWQLLHNKSKGIRHFEPIHLDLEEPRYQHFLGLECLEQGLEIPDEWFGETTLEQTLSKSIWESDTDHELILHPYTVRGSKSLSLEIHLTKRLPGSDQYRHHIRKFLDLARQVDPDVESILIDLDFRDTIDILASTRTSGF